MKPLLQPADTGSPPSIPSRPDDVFSFCSVLAARNACCPDIFSVVSVPPDIPGKPAHPDRPDNPDHPNSRNPPDILNSPDPPDILDISANPIRADTPGHPNCPGNRGNPDSRLSLKSPHNRLKCFHNFRNC